MAAPHDPPRRPDAAPDAAPAQHVPASDREAAVACWGAIYAYIRQAGRSDEQARDLTQGFIADVLLGRGLLAKLDERRGQFRTLLLSAVRNYLADAYRHDHAARRHPGHGRIVAAGNDSHDDGLVDRTTPAPEAAFNRAWVAALVREAAADLQAECLASGREAAWDIFDRRVLRPMLEGAEPPTYEALVARWGLHAPTQVSNTIVAMRRAFATHLVRRMGACSGDGARGQIRELLTLLEGRSP
jgi:RNA polymerase sigma-70 factor (ECF subfamily)